MGKGSASRFRPDGNGRLGLRDRPPGLGALTAEQRAGSRAQRESRSRAAKAGHETRRATEAQRLIDRLCDPDLDDMDRVWATLSGRQQRLVSAWLAAHPSWPGDA
jgi:hypothetical protein